MSRLLLQAVLALLSLSRLPVAGWMVFKEIPASPGFTPMTGLGLAWLLLSDGLDGWLARRLRVEGVFGRVVDHVTDKVVILTLAWALAENRDLPRWVVWVLALREGLSSLVGFLLWVFRRTMPSSRFWGRLTGILGVLGLLAYLGWWPIREALLWTYLGSALLASVLYAWVYGVRAVREEQTPLAV